MIPSVDDSAMIRKIISRAVEVIGFMESLGMSFDR